LTLVPIDKQVNRQLVGDQSTLTVNYSHLPNGEASFMESANPVRRVQMFLLPGNVTEILFAMLHPQISKKPLKKR